MTTDNSGLNAFNTFQLDSQSSEGYFKTLGKLIDAPVNVNQLYTSSIINKDQLVDMSSIFAKAEVHRRRIELEKRNKDKPKSKQKEITFDNRSYSEIQAIYMLSLSPSQNGQSRSEIVQSLVGQFVPNISGFGVSRRKQKPNE